MIPIKVHEEINGQAVQVFDQVSINDFLHHETGYCRWPLCEVFSVHDGLCTGHKMYSEVPEPVKVKPSIAKVSDKRKKQKVVLAKILAVKMEAVNGECQLKLPGCTFFASEPDHIQKASPLNYIDPDNINPSCRNCNGAKEKLVKLAAEKGLSISRFKKSI